MARLSFDQTATVNMNDKADMTGTSDSSIKNPLRGNHCEFEQIGLPSAITDATTSPLTIYFDGNSMENLWMTVTKGT